MKVVQPMEKPWRSVVRKRYTTAVRKRQRTAAVQKLSPTRTAHELAERLGLRQPSAAFGSDGIGASDTANHPNVAARAKAPEGWRTPRPVGHPAPRANPQRLALA